MIGEMQWKLQNTGQIKIWSDYVFKFCHLKRLTSIRAGNALEWVQRVHEPADLWDITFCTRYLGLKVLCAPAVLRPRALQDAPAPADPNS